MSALEVVYMTGSRGAQNCLEPLESGRLCLGSASAKVSICGYPWVRVCRKHAREARRIWDDAAGVAEIEVAA